MTTVGNTGAQANTSFTELVVYQDFAIGRILAVDGKLTYGSSTTSIAVANNGFFGSSVTVGGPTIVDGFLGVTSSAVVDGNLTVGGSSSVAGNLVVDGTISSPYLVSGGVVTPTNWLYLPLIDITTVSAIGRTGTLVYNTPTNTVYVSNGSVWVLL